MINPLVDIRMLMGIFELTNTLKEMKESLIL